jgi:general secretion pathway protein I
MMAVSIIAIALTAVLGSQSQSVSLAGEAKFKTTAPLLAQTKMAEMEAMKPADLASDSGDFGDDFPGYTWTVTVGDVMFGSSVIGSDYLRQIDLTVSWGQGEMYQYDLRLYRFLKK